MTLLIMAAGNGSRYGALKQFDPLGPQDEYLFEFSIYDALDNGFDHIVLITKEQFVNDIKNYLSKRIPGDIRIDVLAQKIEDLPADIEQTFSREKPWGTAHAVWAARNHIEGNFVVINADDYYGKDAFYKAHELVRHKKKEILFGLVPYNLKDTLSDFGTVSRGICKVKGDRLQAINEMTKIKWDKNSLVDFDSQTVLTGDEFASMNFWICDSTVFKEIELLFIEFLKDENKVKNGELYIPLIIQKMIDDGSVDILLTDPSSSWFGVTYGEDKLNAVEVLKKMTDQKKYPSPVWNN